MEKLLKQPLFTRRVLTEPRKEGSGTPRSDVREQLGDVEVGR